MPADEEPSRAFEQKAGVRRAPPHKARQPIQWLVLGAVIGLLVVGVAAAIYAEISRLDGENGANEVLSTAPQPRAPEPIPMGSPQARSSGPECRRDLNCWARKHAAFAAIYCSNRVEKLAAAEFEWTDGWIDPKFPQVVWADEERRQLRFMGDKLRVRNKAGDWQQTAYECIYDPATEAVLHAAARPITPPPLELRSLD